jgi:hypothetical protein
MQSLMIGHCWCKYNIFQNVTNDKCVCMAGSRLLHPLVANDEGRVSTITDHHRQMSECII